MAGHNGRRRQTRGAGGPDGAREDSRHTDGTPGRPGPKPSSTVLEGVLARARAAGEGHPALDGYRAALQALEGQRGGRRRSVTLEESQRELEQVSLPASLGVSLQILRELFRDCEDVSYRGILIGGKHPALLVLIDGMTNTAQLEEAVLKPLIHWGDPDRIPANPAELRAWLESVAVATAQSVPAQTVGQVAAAVLAGDAVLLVEGAPYGMSLSTRGWEQRSVEEPISEPVIRGPREGFTENLRTNTALIRRKLRSPHMKAERLVLGRRTQTAVDLVYLKDVAAPHVVAEVRRRLRRLDVDGIIDTGMIEELIEDQPASLFPQLNNTERPDRVVASLLEGQVAVLADGTPFALLMPTTFWSLLQASEDYYERFWIATALRWLRYLFLLIALLGPSLYIAITTFHQEMLPTTLLLSIANSREGIPFPALIEAFVMEVFFEALREAGVRLPRQVGQAVSIVGALVIGESAVRAGLASAPMVMIVGITGIASFTFPRFNLGIAVRLLRFSMMVLAGTLGLFGIMVGLIALLVHLSALRSFGVPYLQPLAPLTPGDLKDVLIRAPQWLMDRRPGALEPVNRRRQAPWLKPGPGRRGS